MDARTSMKGPAVLHLLACRKHPGRNLMFVGQVCSNSAYCGAQCVLAVMHTLSTLRGCALQRHTVHAGNATVHMFAYV
eukprot:15464694-Alexandrium_andersonii.AAC.1